jgi:YVTN family beta-propeller protein
MRPVSAAFSYDAEFNTETLPFLSTTYVANAASNSVSVIDASTNTVTATVPVGVLPVNAAVF